ncbi:MAG: T9SS type A sorting domain-containing protein, partial [Sphingobacteriales bacterium]
VVNDQLNLKYAVSRNTNVTIKIVDVLGNDLLTIFSQRVETGDQKFTYMLNNKLSRGFYFVRIIAGTESTIKRLSVL